MKASPTMRVAQIILASLAVALTFLCNPSKSTAQFTSGHSSTASLEEFTCPIAFVPF
jgi:hypothetical protein